MDASTLNALYSVFGLFLSLSAGSYALLTSEEPSFTQPQQPYYQMAALAPILMNLGFQELATAAPALYSPILSSWSGPITIFAPSDDSIRACSSCSTPRLLREHLVPGLLSRSYLSKLSFSTKLETASPGRCLTVNTVNASIVDGTSSDVKIFVDGVEITHPDLFNNGRIIIHGIQGFIAPLSPESCSQVFSSPYSIEPFHSRSASDRPAPAITHMMLRDAILRLREAGYTILSIAMRVKYAELAGLHNMTIFALEDSAIFAGGHGYLTDVRFHVVPNRVLMHTDLMNLPEGTVLPTLVRGQHLMVMHSNLELSSSSVRINYVPIKRGNVIYNAKIAVHSISHPFPHLYLADLAMESTPGKAEVGILDGPLGTVGSLSPASPPVVSGSVDLDDFIDG